MPWSEYVYSFRSMWTPFPLPFMLKCRRWRRRFCNLSLDSRAKWSRSEPQEALPQQTKTKQTKHKTQHLYVKCWWIAAMAICLCTYYDCSCGAVWCPHIWPAYRKMFAVFPKKCAQPCSRLYCFWAEKSLQGNVKLRLLPLVAEPNYWCLVTHVFLEV